MTSPNSRLGLAAICFVLGLLLISQFRVQERVAADVRAQSPQNQLTLLGSLIENNAQLREEVFKLDGQIRELQQTDAPNLDTMRQELAHLRLLNGQAEASGPGVRLQINTPLESYWLQDLVNELRNAGAEGIAINGIRILTDSVVAGPPQALRLESQPLNRPVVIEAVGDPDTLHTALDRPGGLVLQIRAQYGQSSVLLSRQEELSLPAHSSVTQMNASG